jgi:hypothetical protein
MKSSYTRKELSDITGASVFQVDHLRRTHQLPMIHMANSKSDRSLFAPESVEILKVILSQRFTN